MPPAPAKIRRGRSPVAHQARPRAGTTIRDVARRAGVSKSSVSRYLQDPATVSAHARKAIAAAIEELDYRPSAAARSLTRRQSRAIGILVHDLSQPWFVEFLDGPAQGPGAAGRFDELLQGPPLATLAALPQPLRAGPAALGAHVGAARPGGLHGGHDGRLPGRADTYPRARRPSGGMPGGDQEGAP